MMIISEEYITGLLTNYYEYADNIRNLPVKELMRRQGEKRFKRTDSQIGHVRGSCFSFISFPQAKHRKALPEINDIEFHLLVRGSCLGKSAFSQPEEEKYEEKRTRRWQGPYCLCWQDGVQQMRRRSIPWIPSLSRRNVQIRKN